MSANDVRVIGLTGGIGSGKTTVASLLEARGFYRIDADAISRSLTRDGGPALPAIREAFGPSVFRDDGSLDRRALGRLVFSDPPEKQKLEEILHPLIRKRVLEERDRALARGERKILLDIPLLFETGMQDLCREAWCVTCPLKTRLSRVAARDGLSRDEILSRIATQLPDDKKIALSDVAIDNGGTLEDLSARVGAALE